MRNKELLSKVIILTLLFFSLGAEESDLPKRQIGASNSLGAELLADPYRLKISAYSEDQQQAYLQLSNGTVWQYLKSHPYREAWLVGDTVFLTQASPGNWVLSNGSYGGKLAVKIVKGGAINLPSIVENRNGGGVIVLNDGSVWEVDFWQRFWNRLWRWGRGDHIIVTPDELPTPETTHQLINVDKGMSSVHVKRLMRSDEK